MDDRPGPGTGASVAGIFLILFGPCLVLLGGSCSYMILAEPRTFGSARPDYSFFVVIALALLGAGVAQIWIGVKLTKRGFGE